MMRIAAVTPRGRVLAGLILLAALFGAGSAAGADRWTAGVPYQYDGAGNIEWMGADQQVYDGAGRLVSSATNGVTRTFTYDAFGNRLTCTQEASPCQYLGIDAATNRIEGVPYDAAGNVEYLREHAYGYDALNMLTSDTAGGGAAQIREEYLYTADDERIAVYTRAGSTPGKGSWRWTVRDESGKVLRELTSTDGSTTKGTANWRWVRDYAYREGQLLASRQNGTSATHHYHLDHLGTPRRVTDDANSIVGRHTYHAFGPEEPGDRIEEAPLSPLKYTGHERDGNLDYMHARYYSPEMGRFLSVDPLMDPSRNMRVPQRWNRYAYALNNPLLRVDPDGRKDTIFVVNTSNAGVFNRTAQARLNAAVSGTRFEGRVQVVGPFATAGQVHASLAQADRTDMVAVLGHSGSTKEWAPGKGGMMFAEKKGQWVTGSTLAAWASSGAGPGVCMVSGCNSAQLAATVSTGANTTTLGTTANVVGGELGMATAVALGALAQGQSPDAAAAAASQELKTPANHCDGNPSCDPNEVARVVAVPPQ